jgi:TonB-linked SusC/RagA family outer membrane protein
MKQKRLKKGLYRSLPWKRLLIILFALNLIAPVFSQELEVSGLVTDENSEPIPGANVVIEGTAKGTVTDANGKYAIITQQNSVLDFSFIGYLPEKVTIIDQKTVNVKLNPDIKKLDEIVVIGYGSVKKSDITGAVSSVKSEAFMATGPTTVQQGLQGKTAGVIISSTSTLNSVPNIRIRGNRSITATNDPLFVVDGIPASNIEGLNPIDIASIEVLKDASATAIYGSRGANGVILVTTKKGEDGKVTVDYDGYLSIGELDRFRKAMNAGEYCDLVREGNRKYLYDKQGGYELDPTSTYSSLTPNYDQDLSIGYFNQDPYLLESLKQGWANGIWDPSKVRGFDWQMAGFRDHSISQSHSLDIRGGSKSTKVYLSGSYMTLQDIQLQSFRDRYTLRMNLDQKIGEKMAMGGTVNYTYLNWDDGKSIPIFWSPLGTPYNSPGGDITQPGDAAYGLIAHPCGEPLQVNSFYDLDGIKRSNKSNNLVSNLYFSVSPVKGLTYRANFGTTLYLKQTQRMDGHLSTTTALGNPNAYQRLAIDRGYTFENILTYGATFQKHSITLTAVQANEKSVSEPDTLVGSNIPFESQEWYALGAAPTQSAITGFSMWSLQSWLGRVNYSFNNKYLLTLSVRYDGSSRLAEGHKWVPFPSVALAWRISEEDFLRNSSLISNLKLRLGYGVTGNSAVKPYSTLGLIESTRYNWGKDVLALAYQPKTLSNFDLNWEKTAQYNIGLDFGLIKGRVSGSVELYQQKTTDLLLMRTIPSISGFTSIMQNIGETQNKGLEISLSTTNIDTKKFSWTTDITYATNKEEIVKLATELDSDLVNNWFVGRPVDTYYDYVAAPNVWGYSKEDFVEMDTLRAHGSRFNPGDLRIIDTNGDKKINEKDRQIRGSKMPKWTISMANTFKYGPFDLYVFMYGAFGQTIYWDPGIGLGGRSNTYNVDYWTPTHTSTKWLAPHADMQMPSNITAMEYWSGDYFKISDITFGYTLPGITSKIGIQKARVYIKVQNPFTFTKFPGIDPEGAISQQRNSVSGLLEKYNVTTTTLIGDPGFTMKTYMFGLNLTF